MSLTFVPEIFEMTDCSEVERSVSVMSLGLCAAIVGGSVSLTEAENRLFNSKVLSRLETLGLPESLIEIVHLGTELEDIQRLVPDRFGESIAQIQSKALAFLR